MAVLTIPFRVEWVGGIPAEGLCPQCFLPALMDSTVALMMGHPAATLYSLELVTVRCCTTDGCDWTDRG